MTWLRFGWYSEARCSKSVRTRIEAKSLRPLDWFTLAR